MAVNEKISGDLTIGGSIIGGGIVPSITGQDYLPVLRINPPNFQSTYESSGFRYLDSSSTGKLNHEAIIPQSGMIETNFILDTDNSIIKIGATPNNWPFPYVGFSANSNGFGINGGGSPYGPTIECYYGDLYLRDNFGASVINIGSSSISIQQSMGGVSLVGMGGVNLNSPSGSIQLSGLSFVIGTDEIQLANVNLIDSGAHTPSGDYLKIYNQFGGNTYYLPLYI